VLGTGSLVNNGELRYSIRSLVKNMLDLRNIYIIGERVNFLSGVVQIEKIDLYKESWKNVLDKTRVACEISYLSEEFLFMNDDFFMLSPFLGADFPFYTLEGFDGGLSGRLSYQVHCPIRYKKEWFMKMPLSVEMFGNFSPRSFYGNFYRAPAKPVQDFIVRNGLDVLDFDFQIKGKDFFSISDQIMLDPDFVLWLDFLFPEPTCFEL